MFKIQTTLAAGGLLLALTAGPGFADVKQVKLGVKGATCATWGVTLRKGLERLAGVDKAKLIMKPPHMEVKMKPGSWPDLKQMTETIQKAGYKPIEGQIELIVTGTVVKQGDRLAIELDQISPPVTLIVVPAKDDPDTAEHLNRHLDQHVEVEGLWQPAKDGGSGGLAVTAIYGADDKKPKR